MKFAARKISPTMRTIFESLIFSTFCFNASLKRKTENVKYTKDKIIKKIYNIEDDRSVNSDEKIKLATNFCSLSTVICIVPKKNKSNISNKYKIINPIEKILSHFKTPSRSIVPFTS